MPISFTTTKSRHIKLSAPLLLVILLSACGSGSDSTGGGSLRDSDALDPTFGTSGKVTTNIGSDDIGQNFSVAVDSTNKVVVAGEFVSGGTSDFAVLRYNNTGTLDSTFGSSGIVITDLGANDHGRSVVIDSSGKIVVGGDSLVTASDFAVARYNGNGTLDSSFNGNGFVTTDFANRAEPAMAITTGIDGKLVAAGFAHNGTDYDFGVVRYNSNGSLDTTFNSTGMVTTNVGGDDRISGVTSYPNGDVIVVGRTGSASYYNIAIVRYNNDGSVDSSFGNSGMVTLDLGGTDDRGREIILDSNGKIVIVGRSNSADINDVVVMRFNDNGSPDTTFGINGIVITDIGGNNDRGRAIALDSSDRIIVLGTSDSQGDNDFSVLRYNNDGSLDTTFGVGGIVAIDFGGNDNGNDVALDSDGMIIVCGRSVIGSSHKIAVARLLP